MHRGDSERGCCCRFISRLMADFLQSVNSFFGGDEDRTRARGSNFNPFEGSEGQSIFQQAAESFQQAQQQPEDIQQSHQPHPPASTNAIRHLPTILVTPEDLVDENNRECCICFEKHALKDRVTRLPCAHIYHPKCILEWLKKSNTCPVCRYELVTDDPSYEHFRTQNMKHRKPRFALYELQRMSIHDLKRLCSRLKLSTSGMVEKRELVSCVRESGKIEVIAAPEPVEYQKSVLDNMGVGKLRRTMEAAGVFFDPIDVVEKQDMVRIFINSGRLALLLEDEPTENIRVMTQEEEAMQLHNYSQIFDNNKETPDNLKPVLEVETVEFDSDDEQCPCMRGTHANRQEPSKIEMFNNKYAESETRSAPFMDYNIDHDENNSAMGVTIDATVEEFIQEPSPPPCNTTMDWREEMEWTAESVISEHETSESTEPGLEIGAAASESFNGNNQTTSTAIDLTNTTDINVTQDVASAAFTDAARAQFQEASAAFTDAARVQFQETTISALRNKAREMNVDLSGCIEKKEMVDVLVLASLHDANGYA